MHTEWLDRRISEVIAKGAHVEDQGGVSWEDLINTNLARDRAVADVIPGRPRHPNIKVSDGVNLAETWIAELRGSYPTVNPDHVRTVYGRGLGRGSKLLTKEDVRSVYIEQQEATRKSALVDRLASVLVNPPMAQQFGGKAPPGTGLLGGVLGGWIG